MPPRRPLRAIVAALVAAMGIREAVPAPRSEIRALWVQRSSLVSTDSIARLVEAARASGLATLLVQVRGRGDALFNGSREPRSSLLDRADPAWDPLATLLRLGHNAGLQVHAWINVNLVASAVELPTAPNHVALGHPEWLMVPRALADELAAIDPGSPGYLGRLARWTRADPGIEGLYLSPVPIDAAAYTGAVVEDLVARYPVDGVHLDYLRYPRDDFDYSRRAIAEFRASLVPRLTAAERRRLDLRQAESILAYPDAFPEEWRAFLRSRLAALVMRIRTIVRKHRPGALVTAAVVPDLAEAREVRLQDWRSWVDGGFVDAVCPMLYAPDGAMFATQLASAIQLIGGDRIWAGIGAFRLPAASVVDRIREARRLGAAGIALFSYETLLGATEDPASYLSEVAEGAFNDGLSPGLR